MYWYNPSFCKHYKWHYKCVNLLQQHKVTLLFFCSKEFIHLPLWKVLQVGHLEHGLISSSQLDSTWSPLLIYQEELIVSNTDRNLKWNFQISKYSGITNNSRRGWLVTKGERACFCLPNLIFHCFHHRSADFCLQVKVLQILNLCKFQ